MWWISLSFELKTTEKTEKNSAKITVTEANVTKNLFAVLRMTLDNYRRHKRHKSVEWANNVVNKVIVSNYIDTNFTVRQIFKDTR